MPVVVRENGVRLDINPREHLPPHVHARYSSIEYTYTIDNPHQIGHKKISPQGHKAIVKAINDNYNLLVSEWARLTGLGQ